MNMDKLIKAIEELEETLYLKKLSKTEIVEQVTKKLGVTQPTLKKIKEGATNLQLDKLIGACKALDLELEIK